MPGSWWGGVGEGQRSSPSRAGGQLPRRPGGGTSHFSWVTGTVKKGPAQNCTRASQALRPSPGWAVTCTGTKLGPLGWQSRAGRGVRGTRGPCSSSRRDPEAHAMSPLPTCPLSGPPQLSEVTVQEWQGARGLEAQRLGAPPHRLDAVAPPDPSWAPTSSRETSLLLLSLCLHFLAISSHFMTLFFFCGTEETQGGRTWRAAVARVCAAVWGPAPRTPLRPTSLSFPGCFPGQGWAAKLGYDN